MKTQVGPGRKVPYTQLCETTLRGKLLSTNVLFQRVGDVWEDVAGSDGRSDIYSTLWKHTVEKPSFNSHLLSLS